MPTLTKRRRGNTLLNERRMFRRCETIDQPFLNKKQKGFFIMVNFEELKKLSEEILKLNKHLDERVHTLEERQGKTETKISQGGPIAAEARAELETINAKISNEIKDYKKLVLEQREAQLASQRPPVPGGYPGSSAGAWKAPATKALEKWIRKGGDSSVLSMDERRLIDFNHMDYDQFTVEQKVMVSAAADLGGFFAGTDLSDKFIQKLFLISPLRGYADTQTIGGEKLLIPSEGSTDTNIFWSDEQTGFQASTDPTLGMIEVYARELNGYLKLSKQNLEDSVFDVEAYILKRLTRQFAQKEGLAFISGDGVARPEGILTNAALASTGMNIYTTPSADSQLLKSNHIINLMHAGKSGYRATGTWLMSNSTIGICRLFADTTTRPLWTMFGDEFRETLFGRPIVEMPDMPNQGGTFPAFTAGQLPIVFGDIGQGYQIVDRVGLTFQTLKELFAIQNQVAYLARVRVGGKVVLPEAISVLKVG
jgi:HK97 family phage major capsid protein